MASFVALLRGINVGGKSMIGMPELRELLTSLGLSEVQSLLQSGNLLFKSKTISTAALEEKLERECKKSFGHPIDFFIRDANEWRTILKGNPFNDEARRDPSHLLIMCLKVVPLTEALSSLKKAITGREYFQARDRHLYLVYPDGVGRSKLTSALIEKKLGARGTARNWNTAGKIGTLLEEISL